jgi:hypothetical protein
LQYNNIDILGQTKNRPSFWRGLTATSIHLQTKSPDIAASGTPPAQKIVLLLLDSIASTMQCNVNRGESADAPTVHYSFISILLYRLTIN